ncbi:MAG: hypothetical protein JSV80_09255 [Acidobacteriota bacterium]|nr:MAG: hypothetical protein JSV80_09255 [Acidobacteriota bacterium]
MSPLTIEAVYEKTPAPVSGGEPSLRWGLRARLGVASDATVSTAFPARAGRARATARPPAFEAGNVPLPLTREQPILAYSRRGLPLLGELPGGPGAGAIVDRRV